MRFSFAESAIPPKDQESLASELNSYRDRLKEITLSGEYAEPESSLCLPGDKAVLSAVEKVLREKTKDPLKAIVVLGIGGSSLGAQAVYQALADSSFARIFFFESIDEGNEKKLSELLLFLEDKSELLIVLASKSGRTTETIANAEYIIGELGKHFKGVEDRIVAVTDEGSELEKAAKEKNITVLNVPKPVGGRFSVFSAAGLLPLMAAGFDAEELLSGAKEALKECLREGDNPAAKSATLLAYWHDKGKKIHDSFFFANRLEALGKWYRQLLGESIGKSEKVGITPTVSIGSADLHSVGQLYLSGPKDKTTFFVGTSLSKKEKLPEKLIFPDTLGIAGSSLGRISGAIYEGTKKAYADHGNPFAEVLLENISEREIGAFMQWKMCEVMYLGKLLGVNAFDQEEVESYKKHTSRLLKENKST